MGGTVHAEARLRRALSAGLAQFGDQLPELIAAELRRTGVASARSQPKLFTFSKHPGERVLTSLPVGATYRVGSGPQWVVIEHASLRGAS